MHKSIGIALLLAFTLSAAAETEPRVDRNTQIERLSKWMAHEDAVRTYEEFERSEAKRRPGIGIPIDSMVDAMVRMMCQTAEEPRVGPPQNVRRPPRQC